MISCIVIPDIVFLDIEMPVENGFKLFNYFDEVRFGVVFLTAYKHYAIDAIRYAAFDYLLKPLDVDDLARVVTRYKKKHNAIQQTERIQAASAPVPPIRLSYLVREG